MRWLLVLFSFAALSAAWAQQPPAGVERGPTLEAETLRQTSIEGIRLGMRPAEAERILLARGYRRWSDALNWKDIDFPRATDELASTDGSAKGSDERGFRYRGRNTAFDGEADITFNYTKIGKAEPTLSYISMDVKVEKARWSDPTAWRAKLLSMFGKPTYWEKWTTASGAFDSMTFAINSRSPHALQAQSSCLQRWQCKKQIDNIDCRAVLRRGLGPALEVSSYSSIERLHVSLTDQDLQAQSVKRDPKFKRLDTRDALCPIRTIH